MLSEHNLDAPGAVDVSSLLRISVTDPTPQPAYPDYKIGHVYREVEGQPAYMWSKLEEQCWVCIFDPANRMRGLTTRVLSPELIELGKVVLEPIEPKMAS